MSDPDYKLPKKYEGLSPFELRTLMLGLFDLADDFIEDADDADEINDKERYAEAKEKAGQALNDGVECFDALFYRFENPLPEED